MSKKFGLYLFGIGDPSRKATFFIGPETWSTFHNEDDLWMRLSDMVGRPVGIRGVYHFNLQFDPMKVTIQFDPDETNEDDIMKWLEKHHIFVTKMEK